MAQLKRNRLDGLNPLAYMGVPELSPSDQVFFPRPPTTSDNQNFYLGTWWIDIGSNLPNPPVAENVWILVSLAQGVATWINFAGGGTGSVREFITDDAGVTIPNAAGQVNVFSAAAPGNSVDNLYTRHGGTSNTYTIELNNSITQPNTNASGTQGLYSLGTTDFVSNYAGSGSGNNAFFGGSGNRTLTTATGCTGVGLNALVSLTTASNNTGIGAAALESATSSINNVAIGSAALNKATTGLGGNIAIGIQSMLNTTTGTANCSIGQVALAANVTGSSCCAFGSAALTSSTVSNLNAFGGGALQAHTTGTNSCGFGYNTQNAITTANNNNSFGNLSLSGASNNASDNCAFGVSTGAAITSGNQNNLYGNSTGAGLTTGAQNTLYGHGVASGMSSGSFNTIVGWAGMTSATTASDNTLVGYSTMSTATTAARNIALGEDVLNNLVSGTDNICVGNEAGNAYTTTESSNVILGSNAGVIGDTNTIRIGKQGSGTAQQNLCYIAGVRGVTTNTSAIAVLVGTDGQFGTVSSSRKVKENIRPLDIDTDKLYKLQPVSFNYKNREYQSIGLIAEDVQKILPQLVVRDENNDIESVAYHDLPVLLLNEIKKLKTRIEQLESKIN